MLRLATICEHMNIAEPVHTTAGHWKPPLGLPSLSAVWHEKFPTLTGLFEVDAQVAWIPGVFFIETELGSLFHGGGSDALGCSWPKLETPLVLLASSAA